MFVAKRLGLKRLADYGLAKMTDSQQIPPKHLRRPRHAAGLPGRFSR
jgi:hypothetical protein